MTGMQMAMMGAGGGDIMALSSTTISDTQTDPIDCSVAFRLRNTGRVAYGVGAAPTYSDQYDWVTPTSNAGLYEARVTLNSGTLDINSGVGTWLALTSDRTWGVTRTAIGTDLGQILVEIRLASSGTVVASATIDFEADVS